ncbi:MAG: polyprenyl synthetase family protein [Bacteroidota bacterium]
MDENISAKENYNNLLGKVNQRLLSYFSGLAPESLYEPIRYFVDEGGKRLRPVLTMLSAGAVGTEPESAIDAGVALEILHNFTLVHDDIMDKSPMRRNRATVHIKWDEPTAILAGDVMVGHAYNLLPSNLQNKKSDKICKSFTNALIVVCEGQSYDMQFNEKKEISIDDYFGMIAKKTACLIETACVIGGYIGNGTEEQVSALRNYGFNIGMAFQVQDDYLDLTAEQAKLGKTVGQDIVEGKKTCLIISALKKAKEEKDIKLLEKFINENGLPIEYVPQMRELMQRLGVFDEIRNYIHSFNLKAKESLELLPKNKYTEMLDWQIEELEKRNR